MSRSTQFASSGRVPPFHDNQTLQLIPDTVTGPVSFLNPTKAQYKVVSAPAGDASEPGEERKDEQGTVLPGAEVTWRSRSNRKGRHILAVNRSHHPHIQPTSHPRAVLSGIVRMFTTCPYWDISYLVGVSFTIGCMVFIACGLLAWWPLAYTSVANDKALTDASGWTSLAGATLFQTGSILLVLEAWNEERSGCFGWAVKRVLEGDKLEIKPDPRRCRHHHQKHGKWKTQPKDGSKEQCHHAWQWYPSWRDFHSHYLHEIGFLASFTLTIGATVFYVSGVMAITPIYDKLSPGVLYGVYYMTYLVGGVLFVLSSALYMLETQSKWYLPAPRLLGWHIGLWNMIGSIGWTLAAAFGYCAEAKGGDGGWCAYQSQLSLTWASAGFVVGSALLWYEAVNKYSIESDDETESRTAGDGA